MLFYVQLCFMFGSDEGKQIGKCENGLQVFFRWRIRKCDWDNQTDGRSKTYRTVVLCEREIVLICWTSEHHILKWRSADRMNLKFWREQLGDDETRELRGTGGSWRQDSTTTWQRPRISEDIWGTFYHANRNALFVLWLKHTSLLRF